MRKKYFVLGLVVGLVINIVIVSAVGNSITGFISDFSITANGKAINTSPVEINETVYLPLLKISEALGLQIKYDGLAKTIEISNDYNSIFKESVDKDVFVDKQTKVYEIPTVEKFTMSDKAKNGTTEEKLKELVSFENDITLFTIYAFMNYTGYNEKNFSTMGTVRKMIRSDLRNKNLNLTNNSFYEEMNSGESYYRSFFYHNGKAPNFHAYESGYLELTNALKEFYVKADIPSLYNKYKKYYDDEIVEYEKEAYIALAELVDTFNIPLDDLGRNIKMYVNLLNAQARASAFVDRGNSDREVILITGPTKPSVGGINTSSVLHEFSHIFVKPVLEEHYDLVFEVENILESKYGVPKTEWESYNTWGIIIEECFVRAFDTFPKSVKSYQGHRIVSKSEMMDIEVRNGFVMSKYIFEKLKIKNNYNDFSDLIEQILRDYIKDNK